MANEKQKPGHACHMKAMYFLWILSIISAFSTQHCSLPAVDLAFPFSAAYGCDFLRQKRQQR